ncbi:4274_t:CDS:2 [Gigaspora rosea]|nr:4274_t:CDS:2 [Gigaspora rosea]
MLKLDGINIKEARNLLNHYGLPCDEIEITNDFNSIDCSDDYDLTKSRKEFPSEDDERTDSVLDTSLHDSEDGVVDYSDLESNVSKIVNPIISYIADLKSDFHSEMEKLHYRIDPNLIGSMKGLDDWQNSEFEKSQDQNRYDSVIMAGKLLDLVLTFSLPNEANERISQARHILWEKALLYRLTSSTDSSSSPTIPEQQRKYVSTTQEDTTDVNQVLPNDEIIENLPDSIIKREESDDRSLVTNGMTKSRRLRNQNRRSNRTRRRSSSVQLENATASGSKPLQESSSSRDAERQDESHHLSTSPKASYRPRSNNGRNSANIPTNNRRFVGFLPSRCFTCGGIGHFANNCPNKSSYITTLSPQQPVRRRRSTRFKRNTNKVDAGGEQ